jgi:hypothetical protein
MNVSSELETVKSIFETVEYIFGNLIEFSAPYIGIFFDFLNLCIEIRYLVGWFLNINPYFEPFVTLWIFTDPFIWTGKGTYPRILNMELTPMINHQLIAILRKKLDAYVYYRKTHQETVEYDEDDDVSSLFEPLFNNSFFENFANEKIIQDSFFEKYDILNDIIQNIIHNI